ncbi:hypothetical protein CPT_Metamorpho_196 [Klebsiella phage Metamorpho]|nr:hypothetical protein CPT_Metamorpho_196 [Klebsiella phage Metamorpho]
MNINKNSWHYKMNFWFKSGNIWKMPKTLCGYFWTTVMHLVMCLAGFLFVSMVGIMFGAPLVVDAGLGAWLGISSGIWTWIVSAIVGIIAVIVLVSVIAITAFSILFGFSKTKEAIKEIKSKKEAARISAGLPTKEAPMFIQYLKARKQKVCPMINYVEGEK